MNSGWRKDRASGQRFKLKSLNGGESCHEFLDGVLEGTILPLLTDRIL